MYESGMSQVEIGDHFGVTQKVIWGFMRRNGIEARVAAKRNQSGANNDAWKGDSAGYAACHVRVGIARGSPQECEVCHTRDSSKAYDWANLTGNYHDVLDYKRMCRSCHSKFDRVHLNFKGGKNASA